VILFVLGSVTTSIGAMNGRNSHFSSLEKQKMNE
jgi:hypothetical protein